MIHGKPSGEYQYEYTYGGNPDEYGNTDGGSYEEYENMGGGNMEGSENIGGGWTNELGNTGIIDEYGNAGGNNGGEPFYLLHGRSASIEQLRGQWCR